MKAAGGSYGNKFERLFLSSGLVGPILAIYLMPGEIRDIYFAAIGYGLIAAVGLEILEYLFNLVGALFK